MNELERYVRWVLRHADKDGKITFYHATLDIERILVEGFEKRETPTYLTLSRKHAEEVLQENNGHGCGGIIRIRIPVSDFLAYLQRGIFFISEDVHLSPHGKVEIVVRDATVLNPYVERTY